MNLTILVPTLDRLIFVEKLLKYYININFTGDIFILDGSDKTQSIPIKQLLKNINKNNFKYFHVEGWVCEAMQQASKFVKTKYVIFTGDDDYLLLEGAKNIIEYLEKEREYHSCLGDCMFISKTQINNVLFFSSWEYSALRERKEENCEDRLLNFLKNYSVNEYAITEKETFFNSLSYVPEFKNRNLCPTRAINDELLVNTFLALNTKIKKIKELYLIRTTDHVRTPNSKWGIPSKYFEDLRRARHKRASDNVALKRLNSDFEKSVLYHKNAVKKFLNVKSVDKIKYKLVNDSIDDYYIQQLKVKKNFVNIIFQKLKFFVGKYKIIIKIKRTIFEVLRFIPSLSKRIDKVYSINNLINKDSKYHSSFMKVFSIFANEK
tara:strand:+ start:3847 stop:4980 length:1134 start_codon:yes stop_codon:yes gene_type:complete